jgi:hypothetical protein
MLKTETTPPSTNTTFDITLLPKGVIYTAFVSAGIGAEFGASSESKTILAMDVPTLGSVSYQETDQILVIWNRVDGASAYSFQIANSNNQPVSLAIPPINAIPDAEQTATIDVTALPDDSYIIQVMANNGALQTAWSVGLPFTIKRLTPDILATQLNTSGVIAPNAAPQIVAAFHNQFAANAGALITLLQAHFPKSTKTPTQLAWALAKSGFDVAQATQALAALPDAQLANVITAIKAAYPVPAIQQQVTQLVIANATAQNAAEIIHTAHADVDVIQMGVVLAINFSSSVVTPAQMAQALHQAGYDSIGAMSTLAEIYPLNSLADLIAAIHSVYPATPK